MTGNAQEPGPQRRVADRLLAAASLPVLAPAMVQAADVDGVRYEFVTNTWGWVQEFARERWYLIAIAVIALIMLWRSLRK